MVQTIVTIQIEDRIRLMSAALAATHYPQKAQDRKRHYVHAHARSTMKYMTDNQYDDHPAVKTLETLLDKGIPLEALFTLVMHFSWPGLQIAKLPAWVPDGWQAQLWDFYEKAKLSDYWQNERLAWENAQAQAEKVFTDVHFKDFLRPFFGRDITEDLIFSPNICYPADQDIGIRVENRLIALTPPPLAWGDSPPWPYDEETMQTHSVRAALSEYARLLLRSYLLTQKERMEEITQKELPINDKLKERYPTWEDQFTMLFTSAIVAIYLEDYVSDLEAKSYMVMEKKARGMTILPGTVSVIRRYLQEHGNKYETLIDFLPVFPAQLRVAKRIVTL